MKEQEFKEIRTLITKTESCLNTLKGRINDYKLEKHEFSSQGETRLRDFREPTYGIKKKIDWKKYYNGLIVIGNVLFVLMMISWALKAIFH